MKRLSIRWRLTMWYGGVLAVVLIAFGTALGLIMRHHLLQRIDIGLHEELAEVQSEVQRADTRENMLRWLSRRFSQHEGFDYQVSTVGGERLFSNPRLGDRRLPVPEIAAGDSRAVYQSVGSGNEEDEPPSAPARRASKGIRSLRGGLPEGSGVRGPEASGFLIEGRRRIVSRRIPGPDGDLVVQVARSLAYYDHEMDELLAALFVSGPLTLIVALCGGYFLARRALVPVDRMTETAQHIEARRLDERLDVSHPDDELGRLAQTLNGMLDRLERSFREMQRFTADASHELRTPIAVIRSEAEVALNEPLNDDQKRNLLSSILEECERLTWITGQLLTLSREDAGILQSVRQPVDLGRLVGEVSETMRPLAEAKHQAMTVETDGPALVCGDPARLRQVLYNLLDNAIKYTPDRGTIQTSVALTPSPVTDRSLVPAGRAVRGQGTVILTVRDSGIGIAPEHLPHVFDRFYRVDKARSRVEGGTGLGLSIVHSIVAAHGGEVTMTSRPGDGTTCTVMLPVP